MATNQELRQASVRAATGTAYTYNDDWMALFVQDGITTGTFGERLLAWINLTLGVTYTTLPDAMQAYAEDQGFTSWDEMGTFSPIPNGAILERSGNAIVDRSGAYIVTRA